jgi:putative membrane protein insertion efficiency factor
MNERVLKFYKRWVSPMFPAACRYVPTCSEYAAEAVAQYGILRGGAMAAWRFVRCNPLGHGGHDPVVKNRIIGSSGHRKSKSIVPRFAQPFREPVRATFAVCLEGLGFTRDDRVNGQISK